MNNSFIKKIIITPIFIVGLFIYSKVYALSFLPEYFHNDLQDFLRLEYQPPIEQSNFLYYLKQKHNNKLDMYYAWLNHDVLKNPYKIENNNTNPLFYCMYYDKINSFEALMNSVTKLSEITLAFLLCKSLFMSAGNRDNYKYKFFIQVSKYIKKFYGKIDSAIFLLENLHCDAGEVNFLFDGLYNKKYELTRVINTL